MGSKSYTYNFFFFFFFFYAKQFSKADIHVLWYVKVESLQK